MNFDARRKKITRGRGKKIPSKIDNCDEYKRCVSIRPAASMYTRLSGDYIIPRLKGRGGDKKTRDKISVQRQV